MKQFKLILLAVAAMLATACDDDPEPVPTETVTFSNVMLLNDGYQSKQSYTEGPWYFINNQDEYSWHGFAFSTLNDTKTPGVENEFSLFSQSKPSTFAIAYYQAYLNTPVTFRINDGQVRKLQSIEVCNTTFTALAIRDGSNFSRKFTSGDWYKVIFKGYDVYNQASGVVEFYAADFRNGKSYICSEWTKVNLSSLGAVSKIEITMDSSDTGEWGINTPCYIGLDNLVYVK